MIEQTQACNYFKGKKGSIQLIFSLSFEDHKQVLSIQLIDTEKYSKYNLEIDQDYIQSQDKIFTMNIESAQVLYKTLIDDFEKLVVTEDGAIQIEIEYMLKKKHGMRVYRLQGTREKISVIQQAIYQIQSLRKEMKGQSQKKYQIIQELQQKISLIAKQNRQINAEKVKLIEKVDLIEQKNLERQKNLINQLQKTSQKVTLLFKLVEEQEYKLKHFEKIIEIQKQQDKERREKEEINLLKEIEQQMQDSRFRLNLIQQHPENPHKESFLVTHRPNSLIITKVNKDGLYINYIGAEPLTKNSTYVFKMKLVQTKKKNILLGIGTKNTFELLSAWKNKETLSYFVQSGSVYEMGASKKGGPAMEVGSVLVMTVNLNTWQILWQINGNLAAERSIDECMRYGHLFMFIMMLHTEDQVQLII